MIWLTRTTVAVALSLLAVSASAQIVTGQTMYEQRSGYWSSFLLVFPKYVYVRVSTIATSGTSLVLALDFVPPDCNPVMNIMIPIGVRMNRDNIRSDVVVTLRTDNGERVDLGAMSLVTMGDTTGMITIPNSVLLMGQIGEMSRGQVLLTKVLFGSDESSAWYNSFSLVGLTAAYRRGALMCANPAATIR